MKKENTIKIVIGTIAICALIIVVYVFYNNTVKEFSKLKNDIDSINSELVNIHKENSRIIHQLNNEESNNIVYDDNSYTVYQIDDGNVQYTKGIKLSVFDKKNNIYILTDKLITYFGKINNNYYYIEFLIIDDVIPTSNVYTLDGTLQKSISGTFEKYDANTKKFTFYENPETVDAKMVTWSPIN